MAKSAAFARIKADILGLIRDVPAGRVVTYADIAGHLDLSARQVAYIMAMLTDEERVGLPWHRAVAADGTLNTSKHGRGIEQTGRLVAEGVALEGHRVVKLDVVRWSPA